MYGKLGKVSITAFLVSAAISGVLVLSRTSEAFWTRQDVGYCSEVSGNGDSFQGGCNVASVGSIALSCPVADSSTHPKTGITTLNVHIDDESTSSPAFVKRCVDFPNAIGGGCGSHVATTTGVQKWSPPTFAGWT